MGNLAVFYAGSGQFEKAQPLFERAMAVFRKVGGNNAFLQKFLAEYFAMERKLDCRLEYVPVNTAVTEVVQILPG
jgi:hypothetical protein